MLQRASILQYYQVNSSSKPTPSLRYTRCGFSLYYTSSAESATRIDDFAVSILQNSYLLLPGSLLQLWFSSLGAYSSVTQLLLLLRNGFKGGYYYNGKCTATFTSQRLCLHKPTPSQDIKSSITKEMKTMLVYQKLSLGENKEETRSMYLVSWEPQKRKTAVVSIFWR